MTTIGEEHSTSSSSDSETSTNIVDSENDQVDDIPINENLDSIGDQEQENVYDEDLNQDTNNSRHVSRRSNRQPNPPTEWWRVSTISTPPAESSENNHALAARIIPKSYKEATSSDHMEFWKAGINREHDYLIRNKTWILVNREQGMNVLQTKYVFKIKNGGPKVRMVCLGCQQMYGVDYMETFSLVEKIATV